MRNKQVGLQPLKNFQRIVNPKSKRFHFSTFSNSKGQFIVKMIANYAGNYYKSAGLRVGDEIVAIDNKPYADITREERWDFYTKDTLVFDVVRNKHALKIVVPVNKEELQGE